MHQSDERRNRNTDGPRGKLLLLRGRKNIDGDAGNNGRKGDNKEQENEERQKPKQIVKDGRNKSKTNKTVAPPQIKFFDTSDVFIISICFDSTDRF